MSAPGRGVARTLILAALAASRNQPDRNVLRHSHPTDNATEMENR